MSDEDLSKRERQKQRRQAKLEDQRKEHRAARARRLLMIGLVIAVVLAGIGVVVANQIAERNAVAERAENAAARLDELGCTEVMQTEDFGGGQHIPGAALAQNSPETIYQNRPASAGPHIGSVAASGVYDETIDERLVVHNLEHGYVGFWWDPDADQETIDAVKSFVEENRDEFPKLIAAPYNTDLPDEQAVTTVAWTFRQECEQFDPDVALTFMDQHYGLAGVAPEKNLEPHSAGGQGVQAEPVLFPPLADPEAAATEVLPSASAPAGDVDDDPTPITSPDG